jgi:hypothetical protein
VANRHAGGSRELGGVDLEAAEAWIRETIRPTGRLELEKERPWATVLRVPSDGGRAFFKACRPVQAFEPGLTAALAERWPDRVVEVMAHDPERAWLLTADAGLPLDDLGNPPELWLEVLPRFAELQRGEGDAGRLVELGVPELRTRDLPRHYEGMVARDLPLEPGELEAARRLGPQLEALVEQLAAAGIADTIDHADLHHRSVFSRDGHLRILDWGDASISHPFFSLLVTFAWLRDVNGLAAHDPWFGRLRDAYLEPWGAGLVPVFDVALRLGRVTRALAWLRHLDAMGAGAVPAFDEWLPDVLREAFAAIEA